MGESRNGGGEYIRPREYDWLFWLLGVLLPAGITVASLQNVPVILRFGAGAIALAVLVVAIHVVRRLRVQRRSLR